jgi:hypothetical protein
MFSGRHFNNRPSVLFQIPPLRGHKRLFSGLLLTCYFR